MQQEIRPNMKYDYVIIGAGISGAAAAYELSGHGSVALLEAETAPGYHSTGRSAALYTRNFGGPVVRSINQASYDFFAHPRADFCDRALLTPRGLLTVAMPSEERLLVPILAQSDKHAEIEELTAGQACEMAPLLRPDSVAAPEIPAPIMT